MFLVKKFTNKISQREKLVVLGSGWGAYRVIKLLGKRYELVVVSPRNFLLFTPLLPSAATGNLEFQSIIQPIHDKHTIFLQGSAVNMDPDNKLVHCKTNDSNEKFSVSYDRLVISVGATVNTFDIPGVNGDNVCFLKEVEDGSKIRNQLNRCLELASEPNITPEERKKILHFVVVGGGPSGIELVAELADFVKRDVVRYFKHLDGDIKISLLEASPQILSSIDRTLVAESLVQLHQLNVQVLTKTTVKEVRPGKIILGDDSIIESGLIVWSTGVKPYQFTLDLPFEKDRGRILVDDFLRVKGHSDIYAIGDCAKIIGNPLPLTAQVASQQGEYLGKSLIKGESNAKPFEYHNQGTLVYVGNSHGIVDTPFWKSSSILGCFFRNFVYLFKSPTFRQAYSVFTNWLITGIWGRDFSYYK